MGLRTFYIRSVLLVLLSVTESCNVTLISTATPSYITSPNYPKNYPRNTNCWWRIGGSNENKSVMVTVVDNFIEYSNNCTDDSLSFYDGSNASAPLLRRICSVTKPALISSGSSMYVRFRTNGRGERTGFKLEYVETTRCGGTLTATSNSTVLQSPCYRRRYLNDMNCTWFITAENDRGTVVVEFQETSIGGMKDCSSDFISVYSGNTTNENLFLGKFCERSQPTFQSSKNSIRIDFKTDGLWADEGFVMKYKAVEAGSCSLTLMADTKPTYFVSPGYPDAYSNDLDCVWEIFSPFQHVHLDVIDSDLEVASPHCSKDVVKVYSGNGGSRADLGSLCGNSTPTYDTYSWGAMVEFRTDAAVVGKGFRVRYQSDGSLSTLTTPDPACGQRELPAEDSFHYLHSPGYPVTYQNNEQCTWTMTAVSMSGRVHVIVTDIHLEFASHCQYDNVTAYDGRDINSPLLVTWCERTKPTLTSTGRSLTLVFKTDRSTTLEGFNITYFQVRGNDYSALVNIVLRTKCALIVNNGVTKSNTSSSSFPDIQ